MHNIRKLIVIAVAAVAMIAGLAPAQASPDEAPSVSTLATGIPGANGSAIGPDGALYVTASETGQILRIDPDTGATSVYASGLPTKIAPIGGPMDLVFHDDTAYVLVSLVGGFFGTSDANGIYRMDGPDEWTVIADLGAWAEANPPGPDIHYFIPTGVHYSIDNYRGGFVVAEAHHNVVLEVSADGDISAVERFGNVVPTGLATDGDEILVAMAGPQPHLPADGQILKIEGDEDDDIELVADGGRLLVDVESGKDAVFGLAQGVFPVGQPDGSPANPGTGELMIARDGTLVSVVTGLDQPVSVEIVRDTAYVVGLQGTITRIDGLPKE